MAVVEKSAQNEEVKRQFKHIIDQFRQEEEGPRHETVRELLKNESFWQGRQDVYWNDRVVAWQTSKEAAKAGLIREADILDYDKYVNIDRAHGKAVIAASSVEFPKYTFLPEDFQSPVDVLTGEVYGKIGEVIQRQNDGKRLFAKAFFTRWNQHFVATYNYHDFDPSYGMVDVEVDEPYTEEVEEGRCPFCESAVPEIRGICGACNQGYEQAQMVKVKKKMTRKVIKSEPRGREILEVYGPKNVIIPRHCSRQEDIPYLRFERDYHITQVLGLIDKLGLDKRDDIEVLGEVNDEAWLRLPHPYSGTAGTGLVLVSQDWLRPSAFWQLGIREKEKVRALQEKYPSGARVISINHQPLLCMDEALDDHWTLSISATSDSIHDDPLCKDLLPINEMENESLQLALETIKQAISELFADPNVLNFKVYENTEKSPGTVVPAEAKPGFGLDSAFFETRPASLSKEFDTFQQRLQMLGQLVVHAFPSIFGGSMQGGSQTYSEYAKSAQQALQVLGLDYSPIVDMFGKAVRKGVESFIVNMQTENMAYSYKDNGGAQIDLLIKKSEAIGRIGNVTVDNSTQLPISWAELRAFVLEIFNGNNPQLLATFFHPENTTYVKSLIGMRQLFIPGEPDRKKQLLEIADLVSAQPMPAPPPPETGDPVMDDMNLQAFNLAPPPPIPSVEVLDADNHQIHIDTISIWEVSEAGQDARLNNRPGYDNVMLHKAFHMQKLAMLTAQQNAAPPPKEKGNANPKPNAAMGSPNNAGSGGSN